MHRAVVVATLRVALLRALPQSSSSMRQRRPQPRWRPQGWRLSV